MALFLFAEMPEPAGMVLDRLFVVGNIPKSLEDRPCGGLHVAHPSVGVALKHRCPWVSLRLHGRPLRCFPINGLTVVFRWALASWGVDEWSGRVEV